MSYRIITYMTSVAHCVAFLRLLLNQELGGGTQLSSDDVLFVQIYELGPPNQFLVAWLVQK